MILLWWSPVFLSESWETESEFSCSSCEFCFHLSQPFFCAMEESLQLLETTSPDALMLPKPRFALSPTLEGKTLDHPICNSSQYEIYQQQLQERLQQLRLQQESSMILLNQYARALTLLQISGRQGSAVSSVPPASAPAVLGTQPENPVTMRIEGLPSYYTQGMFFSEMVKQGFHETHLNLPYIPFNQEHGCNGGYAVVNFTHPEFARQFRARFHGQSLGQDAQTLIVYPAAQQGYETNYSNLSLRWTGRPPLCRGHFGDQIRYQ